MPKKKAIEDPLSIDTAEQLIGIAHYIDRNGYTDDSICGLIEHAAAALRSSHCSIILLKKDEETKKMRLIFFPSGKHSSDESRCKAAALDKSVADHVVVTGAAVRFDNINTSRHAVRHGSSNAGYASYLSAPILMNDEVAGVINFSKPEGRTVFTEDDLAVARLVGILIGKSLQTVQLQNLLKSRFVHLAIVQEAEPSRNETITLDGKNTPEMAKILSRTFFREMTKAGFGSEEILGAATELISLLSERLSRLKTRKESGAQ